MSDYSRLEGPLPLFVPAHVSIEVLLAEYFKIDLAKVEREKRQILRDFQRRAK